MTKKPDAHCVKKVYDQLMPVFAALEVPGFPQYPKESVVQAIKELDMQQITARTGHNILRRFGLRARRPARKPFFGKRQRMRRLAADIAHHEQRLHDLVFDDIELELGGSE